VEKRRTQVVAENADSDDDETTQATLIGDSSVAGSKENILSYNDLGDWGFDYATFITSLDVDSVGIDPAENPIGHDASGTVWGVAELYRKPWSIETALFNLMEVHGPYWISEKYEPRETAGVSTGGALAGDISNSEAVRESYEGSVKILSDRYRDLFATLQTEFDWVITCSDHGELLGEHSLWGHGFGLYPELVHIPLVVSCPRNDILTT